MSRIIVKNLPNNTDANKLREKFTELGHITDLQLKYTPEGKFRKFCFIGYETVEDANKAVEHFNKTYFGTSKLQVELCSDLGDVKKPKAWSKYSAESTAYKKIHNKEEPEKKEFSEGKEKGKKKKKDKNKNKIVDEEVVEQIKKHKDDPDFIEFMELHGKADKVHQIKDDEINEGSSDEELNPSTKTAQSTISDLEYLKTKIKGDNAEETATKIIKDTNKTPSKLTKELYTVKISNLPYKTTKKNIRSLLNPITPTSIRLPPLIKGIAYVGFETEKEKRRALIKNKTFLHGKQLSIVDYKTKIDTTSVQNRWKEQEETLKHEENIAESGRIFIRNLSYSVTEEEIQNLFSKYGPIAEIILPIDKFSRQIKGYGIVTYLMPEHAVNAYSELDGSVLHGRMLHLLPAKAKENEEEINDDENNTNYKSKKAKDLKTKSGSSHNWNTLFLDLNAVSEVIAQKYNVSKEDVLTGKDAAVRLALAETQLVTETKNFLEENGVKLDAFNQTVTRRSKTVILVKNLPANTTCAEIREIFAKYGELGRVLLPPSGITGLVEFLEPAEARIAFRKLAYSKFKYLPLYLEWAPDELLVNKDIKPKKEINTEQTETETTKDVVEVSEVKDEENEDEEINIDTCASLFVKNLNFEATEDDLKEHFKSCGKIATTIVARKKDPKKPGSLLSMGYGFVHFYLESSVNEALKRLQGSELKGHILELKRSNRTLPNDVLNSRKKTNLGKQKTGTKIMVRNVPFEVTKQEIIDLFKIFGELKFVRLPKKLVGTGSHRGFAFVEFVNKSDAKRAMKSLCQSTHLLGRRLVLEWAESDDDVNLLRKRTAKHFHQDDDSGKNFKKSVMEVTSKDETGEFEEEMEL